jgi:hypothetical protein
LRRNTGIDAGSFPMISNLKRQRICKKWIEGMMNSKDTIFTEIQEAA